MYIIKKLYHSLCYSIEGLIAIWHKELSFRLEVYASFILIPIIFFIPITNIEKCILILLIFLLFVLEIINTCIELLVDRISKDIHPLSKLAKDAGSAAVFLVMLMNIIAWIFAIYPLLFL